jgi:hypothetical protein
MKKDIVDTTTTHRYIEYRPKEERERKFAELKAEAAQLPYGSHRFRQVAADLEAGSGVIVHQESKMTQKWKEFAKEYANTIHHPKPPPNPAPNSIGRRKKMQGKPTALKHGLMDNILEKRVNPW